MDEIIKKCIENSISRVENSKHRMNAFAYISYFCRRNDLTAEEEFYIREKISEYIDENTERLLPLNFTINGIAC